MAVIRSLTNLRIIILAGLLTFHSMLATYPALGQETGPIDANAMQVLEGMSNHLAQAKSLSVRAQTLFDDVRKSGIKIKSARVVRLILRRPNSLRALSIGDSGAARSVWFDGTKFTVLQRDTNEVMELDFSGNIDGLLDELIDKHEAQLPLADLLYSNIAKGFKESIISAEYIGTKLVDGVKCHHLSFESTGADWQIWIQADANPVPRRFAITYVNLPEKPEFLAALDRWSLDGEVADYHLAPSIPEGAKTVAFGHPKSSQ